MSEAFSDIVNDFPTASSLSENKDMYSLFLFEEELRSLCRTFMWAASAGYNPINISNLSQNSREFLEEKGYRLEQGSNNTVNIYY